MSAKPFLDSNVLVYAFASDDARMGPARDLIFKGGCVSVQVLNEFVNVSRRKLRRDWDSVRRALDVIADCVDEPAPVTLDTHRFAFRLAERYGLAFYDSLIVAAAQLAGCRVLYSEDMQHGQVIDGVTIRNPFIAA